MREERSEAEGNKHKVVGEGKADMGTPAKAHKEEQRARELKHQRGAGEAGLRLAQPGTNWAGLAVNRALCFHCALKPLVTSLCMWPGPAQVLSPSCGMISPTRALEPSAS